MKLTLNASLLLMLFLGGCMSPINANDGDGETDIVKPDPLPDDGPSPSIAGSSVSFAMDAEQFANLAAWLGHENTVTIEKAVHVQKENVTLDAKAGTRFIYTMGDESGKFTFERPFPTVKAGFTTKLIGGVSLHDVTINADGSGIAATGLGRYPFRWMDKESDSGSAAVPTDLPEVWAFSCRDSCPRSVKEQVELAKKEFAEAKDLPFKVVWKELWEPCIGGTPPAFWFHVSADKPTCGDVGNTRLQNGWKGLKHFIETWKYNRDPKRFIRAGGPAPRPFALSVLADKQRAAVIINGSHTPPRWLVMSHLLQDGIHRGRHSAADLDRLTTGQLYALHDADHGQ